MDDSAITCDEIIESYDKETKTIPTNFNEKKGTCKICNSLPIEKILTFHNVIILIKSVINKYKNHYNYNIYLEKGSYKDRSNAEYF